jgi:hypothetical protein
MKAVRRIDCCKFILEKGVIKKVPFMNVILSARTVSLIVLSCIASVSLGACGGGGGGGGGASPDSATGVRVLHAAIDATPVDVLSVTPAQTLVSKSYFANDRGYQALPEGELSLQLTRAQTPSVILDTFSVKSTSESRFSIFLYGDTSVFGLRTKILSDVIPDETGAHIRIVDGVTGASTVRSTIVVRSPEEHRFTVSTPFGDASEYLNVPAGAVTLRAVREADGYILATIQFEAAERRGYTVLLAGESQYYAKGVVLTDR